MLDKKQLLSISIYLTSIACGFGVGYLVKEDKEESELLKELNRRREENMNLQLELDYINKALDEMSLSACEDSVRDNELFEVPPLSNQNDKIAENYQEYVDHPVLDGS